MREHACLTILIVNRLMHFSTETLVAQDALNHIPNDTSSQRPPATHWPAALLGLMMFLVPALGVPHDLLLQDTFKSALVAFGVLATALLFFWQQRERNTSLRWHGLVVLPLVLMGYALASMAWSHTYLAGVEAIRWFVLGLLLWLGLNTLNDRQEVSLMAWSIHGGAVVASIWTALQFWLDFSLFPQGPNPASTFINRNFFAEYAVCALPFSVYVLANLRRSYGLGWVAFSVALHVVAILMTGTRSALIAMGVLLPVLTVILWKYHPQFAFAHWPKLTQVLVSLIVLAGVLAMGSVPSGNLKLLQEKSGTTALQRSVLRVASMTDKKEFTEGSFSIRAVMWKATARMMLANPLTGVGAGAWEVQIPLYQRADEPMEIDYYAHNEFLQLLSEYGMPVGGLVLVFLWAYLLKAAGTTWRLCDTDKKEGPVRALTLASLLTLMIVSNAGFPWHLAGCGALLALCLAILAASDTRLGQRTSLYATPMRWQPLHARVALVVGSACMVVAIYVTWQAALVEYKLVHAIRLGARLSQSRPADAHIASEQKARLLQDMRDGIAISRHYRKLTPIVADLLAAGGDLDNAVWIWESVLASRPHIAVFWSNLALAYSKQGQLDRAQEALQQVQRLKPGAIATRTLEIILLSRSGHEAQAVQRLVTQYDQGLYDYDMLQAGYRIGFHSRNWPLAIRSLKLRNATWPDEAADGYFRLGNIYADPALKDDVKALAAFRSGLSAVPEEQKENFLSQVPARYRSLM